MCQKETGNIWFRKICLVNFYTMYTFPIFFLFIIFPQKSAVFRTEDTQLSFRMFWNAVGSRGLHVWEREREKRECVCVCFQVEKIKSKRVFFEKVLLNILGCIHSNSELPPDDGAIRLITSFCCPFCSWSLFFNVCLNNLIFGWDVD